MFLQHTYHDKVNTQKPSLQRVEIDGKRFYESDEGFRFMSVTTYLGQFGNASLEKWKAAVGAEAANRICHLAATKGTNIHLSCEKYLNNEENYTGHLFYHEMMDWKMFKPVLDARVNNIVAQELQMYSKRLKLAGTVDCVAELDNTLSIIDFKTARRDKSIEEISTYWLQCAAYAVMMYELYGIRIDQLAIMMAVEHSHINVYTQPSIKWIKRLTKLLEIRKVEC